MSDHDRKEASGINLESSMESISGLDSYPLRQCVMHGDACFQDAGWVAGMFKTDRYMLKSDGVSARLYAVSECALDEAQMAVQEAYGPLVLFGLPEIHRYFDTRAGRTMQPVMFVKVQARRAFAHEGLPQSNNARGLPVAFITLASPARVLGPSGLP